MNARRFDDLLRAWTESRRSLLWGAFTALATGSVPGADMAAKNKNKKKRKKKKQAPEDPEPQLIFPLLTPCNGAYCSGCCDASGECQTGVARDACGVGNVQCQTCQGDQVCTFINDTLIELGCCVQYGGACSEGECCSELQCFAGHCCTPIGSSCSTRAECCTGDCANGTCCLLEGIDCLLDGECCGDLACKTASSGAFVCCSPERQCGAKCCPVGQICRNGKCRECDECQVDNDCCKGLRCLDDQLSPGTKVCCPVDKDCGDACCSPSQVCVNRAASQCSPLCNEGPCPGQPELCLSCLGNPPDDCICCSCEVPRIRECNQDCD